MMSKAVLLVFVVAMADIDHALGQLQLTDKIANHHGNLEVEINSVWGSVCGLGFGKIEADVACFELGFGWAEDRSYGYESNIFIQITNVLCKGDEEELLDCDFETNTTGCSNEKDAVILECVDPGKSPAQPPTMK